MTREEATAFLQGRIYLIDKYYPQIEDYREALVLAIKALEQEPCEDAISRQALYEWLDGWKEKNKYYHPHTKNEIIPICEVVDIIQSLPSVTPQQKTGHNCNKDYADCDQFVCSECGIELQDWHKVVRDDEYDDISYQEYAFRFCPSCGCEIKEVDE